MLSQGGRLVLVQLQLARRRPQLAVVSWVMVADVVELWSGDRGREGVVSSRSGGSDGRLAGVELGEGRDHGGAGSGMKRRQRVMDLEATSPRRAERKGDGRRKKKSSPWG